MPDCLHMFRGYRVPAEVVQGQAGHHQHSASC